jgi:hypothetical protein
MIEVARREEQAGDDVDGARQRRVGEGAADLDQLSVGPDPARVLHEDAERRPIDSLVLRA